MSTQSTFDPGPVPPATAADKATAQRVRIIAALHAMVLWLTEHPDAPAPRSIDLWAGPQEGTDDERIAELDAFAALHNGERYGIELHEYAKVELGTTRDHGANINYKLVTTRKDSKVPACSCTGDDIEHQNDCARVAWARRR